MIGRWPESLLFTRMISKLIQIAIDPYLPSLLSPNFYIELVACTSYMIFQLGMIYLPLLSRVFDLVIPLTALLDLTNDWFLTMDNGLLNGILFLDHDCMTMILVLPLLLMMLPI